ncbi:hypothetical protein SAMD00019534_067020 [Acytostelium subglobosum LB1]|uniref:hypothetical protein n=1 Tax=Acytostelium subglobosum LB1 TaxID=1410327 RepID=UPI0006450176|nr:hypothetical protein SAMD00019534_067020 [Acytostelium subglobosum LB1]GAM23527.1 hypothetical protein SAMD00019534_067020 [Acytostelium subglobosum LB1]|eukprot:XP_012753268.1 hypothetical protein SAMD00019534_067020 [Acytostelium subglobosum LB1]
MSASTLRAPSIIIVGGGIAGLATAALARHAFRVTVAERAPSVCRANVGGGIALWGNAQNSLDLAGPTLMQSLRDKGAWMAPPEYRDKHGNAMAKASPKFSERFPILCLHRDDLLTSLYAACIGPEEPEPPVEFVTSASYVEYKLNHGPEGGVQVLLSDGRILHGDVLVATDGINSLARTQLLNELHTQPVSPNYCGYTYFRANVEVDETDGRAWHESAFEAWGDGNRFGYVPLRGREVFWFAAIPKADHMASSIQVEVCDDQRKEWLLDTFRDWKGGQTSSTRRLPISYEQLIKGTPSKNILQSDIYKVPSVDRFPWHGHDGRVVLLGDSAHATAPNLAQGAGLCIEDAATYVDALKRNTITHPHKDGYATAAKEFEATRKQRAHTVQTLADAVAFVGQMQGLQSARDWFMRTATKWLPAIQQRIFEAAVSYSLGGTRSRRTWIPPPIQTSHRESNQRALDRVSVLGRVLGHEQMSLLASHVHAFKSCLYGGSGAGSVTVERGQSWLATMFANMFGIPQNMIDAPFDASVSVTQGGDLQTWRRTFGLGQNNQKTYATTQRCRVGFDGSLALTEGVGGPLDSWLRFYYDVSVIDKAAKAPNASSLKFESKGILLFGVPLPLPSWILPTSRWIETPTRNGWHFDGQITLPLIGKLMRYYGNFAIRQSKKSTDMAFTRGRAIIAGGSGLVGRSVSKHLAAQGWEVVVLTTAPYSEFPRLIETMPDVHRVEHWDGRTPDGWGHLVNSNTVLINLAGDNPGTQRWTRSKKETILQSRLDSIRAISQAIQLAATEGRAPRAFLQASAAGIHGDRGDQILSDLDLMEMTSSTDQASEQGTNFRVTTCQKIEEEAKLAVANHPDTILTMLRIGHVLSRDGGIFPSFDLASLSRAGRLGTGQQYVPWIHIDDVGLAITSVANSNSISNSNNSNKQYEGIVNVCAPTSNTNEQLLSTIASVRGRLLCLVTVPPTLLKLMFGQSASVALDSERLVPDRLLSHGHQFQCTNLKDAIQSLS